MNITAIGRSTVARRWAGYGLLAAVAVFFLLAPVTVFTTGYRLDIARLAFYMAILTSTWSLQAGVAGQFSFAHVAVAGLAGYSGAIWSRRMFGNTPWAAGAAGSIVLGTLFGLVVATLLALLLRRLRGAYLALFTIAFSEVARLVIVAESDLTGGRLSMPVFPQLPGSDTAHYYVLLGLLLATLGVVYLMLRSRFGLNLHAMREDHEAAAAMGVNVTVLKVQVIAASSLLAAFGGALYFHTTARMVPEDLDLILMSQVIAFAVIGGLESPLAATLSAVLLTLVMENLRTLDLGPVQLGILAAVLIAVPVVLLLRNVPHPTRSPQLRRAVRAGLPWFAPALALLAWWLLAPGRAAGLGSPGGWVVVVAGLALLGWAAVTLGRTDLPLPARHGAVALCCTVAALLAGARMLLASTVHVEVGVWRLALFGLLLVITLRFSPNGLFLPVFDYFASRTTLRRMAVRHRDVEPDIPVQPGGAGPAQPDVEPSTGGVAR